MQPYCNIVTLTLSQTPTGFALFGADDQCGAAVKGSAVGVAVFNPNGTVGVNFTIVTSPGGKGLQVAATVSPSTGQERGSTASATAAYLRFSATQSDCLRGRCRQAASVRQ
jgi:hypothetical protein